MIIFLAVLIPLITGLATSLIKWKNKKQMHIYTMVSVLITTALVWTMILTPGVEHMTLYTFPGDLSISFGMDGLSMVFAGMISLLWPLATLYSYE